MSDADANTFVVLYRWRIKPGTEDRFTTAWAEATRRLLNDTELRRRMGAEAVTYATSQHDLPAAAARIDAVLRRVRAEHSSDAAVDSGAGSR